MHGTTVKKNVKKMKKKRKKKKMYLIFQNLGPQAIYTVHGSVLW